MIKINRSKTIPPSLLNSAAEFRYRNEDVIARLIEDSGDKCYLCESSPVSDPEVEHLLPHKAGKYPERKYDWNNLFYACRHCNSVKNKQKYDDGIIDCCVVDPEQLLSQELIESEVHVEPLVAGDQKVHLTAELIEEIFMTDNPPLRQRASDARLSALQLRMNAFYEQLLVYTQDRSDFAKIAIGAMLQRDAAFAGFTRCFVRKHLKEYPELSEYLN